VNRRGRLAGRTIVITRAAGQSGELRARLEGEGGSVVEVPTIDVVDAPDGHAALAAALGERWDWVVVSSPNGVERLAAAAGDDLARLRIAVVGPGTAAALRTAGAEPALVPSRAVAEGLVEAFGPGPGRVLVAQGDRARPVLADGLRSLGWEVHTVVAYRTVTRRVPPHQLDAARRADAIAFTSASTVEGWVAATGSQARPPVVVSIGPVTTAAAVRLGLPVDATADPHTLDGLVDAISAALAE
jgi:uroporphyrinogen-III synthase